MTIRTAALAGFVTVAILVFAACGSEQSEPSSRTAAAFSPVADPPAETQARATQTPFFIEPRLFSWVEAVADREGWEIVGQCPYFGVEMGWCYFQPIVDEDIVYLFIGRTGSDSVFTLTLQATESGELVELSLEQNPGDIPGISSVDGLVVVLRNALRTRDAQVVASLVRTAEYLCDPEDSLAAVPECSEMAAGTPVQVIRWTVYCTACDAFGYATRSEFADWMTGFFATSEGVPDDDFGPSELVLIDTAQPTSTGFAVSATGIGDPDLFGYPRRHGRWVVTFGLGTTEGGWRIESLTLADPDSTSWVLPELVQP